MLNFFFVFIKSRVFKMKEKSIKKLTNKLIIKRNNNSTIDVELKSKN